jgi:hypothetical protein
MMRLFDFQCTNNHVTERFVDVETRTIKCPLCEEFSHRMISAPRANLEGFSGDFPGAYDRWSRVRAEKQALERKKNS